MDTYMSTAVDLFDWLIQNVRTDLPDPSTFAAVLDTGYDGDYVDYIEEFDGPWDKSFDVISTADMLIPLGLDAGDETPLVHFIFAEEMNEGVIHGVADMTKLGITSAAEKIGPGFNYAYRVDGEGLPKYFGEMLSGIKCELDYGDVGFVLRAPHLRVWHRADHEEQALLMSQHLNENGRVMITRDQTFLDAADAQHPDLLSLRAWRVHAEDGTSLHDELLSFSECIALATQELDLRTGVHLCTPT